MKNTIQEVIKKYGLISKVDEVTVGPTFGYTYGLKHNFDIPFAKMPEFLYEYCKLVKSDIIKEEEQFDNGELLRNELGFPIGELAGQNIPLMVNMSFKFDTVEGHDDLETSFYDSNFVIQVIK